MPEDDVMPASFRRYFGEDIPPTNPVLFEKILEIIDYHVCQCCITNKEETRRIADDIGVMLRENPTIISSAN